MVWRARLELAAAAAGTVALCLCPAAGRGADWPAFRGPDWTGIAAAEEKWDPAALSRGRVLWTAEVGVGYSSVSIAGGRAYTMGNRGNRDTVFALDAATGREAWKHSYASRGGSHAGPRSTPTVRGGRVYVLSRHGRALCLAATDGRVLWERSLADDAGAEPPRWGMAGSPRVEGDLLLLNACKAGIALDRNTGRTVWSSGPGVGGYASPAVYGPADRRCVAIFGELTLEGVLLETGKPLFSYGWKTAWRVNAADPVVAGGRLFVTSGYGRGGALLDVERRSPRVVWESRSLSCHFGTPVLVDGHLYGVSGNAGSGTLVCLEVATGRTKWSRNTGFGSLIAAGGQLIVLDETGSLAAVKASPVGYSETARTVLFAGDRRQQCWTSPALSDGRIYCRAHGGRVLCLDVTARSAPQVGLRAAHD